jgi:hypothetical protein
MIRLFESGGNAGRPFFWYLFFGRTKKRYTRPVGVEKTAALKNLKALQKNNNKKRAGP